MAKERRFDRSLRKFKHDNTGNLSEEEYEEYMKRLYGMAFIAGETSAGVPYGTFLPDAEVNGGRLWKLHSRMDRMTFPSNLRGGIGVGL